MYHYEDCCIGLYNDLEWTPINDYITKYDTTINKQIDDLVPKLSKLKYTMIKNNDKNSEIVTKMENMLLNCKR